MPLQQSQPSPRLVNPNGNGTSSPVRGQGMESPNMSAQPGSGLRQSPQAASVQRSGSASNMPTPQTVQQPPTPSSQGQRDQPTWQREFNNIVDLIGAQPNKHYVASPPELEMILARTSAGALPK
jgi:CCR4-NOT transcriptional complex subunit CAF120